MSHIQPSAKNQSHHFVYIDSNDTEGLYIDGKITRQGDFFSNFFSSLCSDLEIDCFTIYTGDIKSLDDYLYKNGKLPEKLQDLPSGHKDIESEYVHIMADDWEGLYHNGFLVAEGRSLTYDIPDIFSLLGVEVECRYADPNWLASEGFLPDDLQDVILAPGQKPLIGPILLSLPQTKIPRGRKRLSPLTQPPENSDPSL